MCQWVDSLSTLCQSAPQSEHATFSRQRPAHPRAETSSRRHIFRLYQTVERPPVPSRRAAASLGLAIGPARRHGWEPTSRPSRVSRHVCGSTLIRYRPCSCAITPHSSRHMDTPSSPPAPRRASTAPMATPLAGTGIDSKAGVETLFSHPDVKIISFEARASRVLDATPATKTNPDIDAGSLPWKSPLERIIAVGKY